MSNKNTRRSNPYQLELALFDQECSGVMINDDFSLDDIIECNTSQFVGGYHPVRFGMAVKVICNTYGLQEHEAEGVLLNLHVFGTKTYKLSVEEITQLWDAYGCGNEIYDGDSA
jgi:hypothetical protein